MVKLVRRDADRGLQLGLHVLRFWTFPGVGKERMLKTLAWFFRSRQHRQRSVVDRANLSIEVCGLVGQVEQQAKREKRGISWENHKFRERREIITRVYVAARSVPEKGTTERHARERGGIRSTASRISRRIWAVLHLARQISREERQRPLAPKLFPRREVRQC